MTTSRVLGAATAVLLATASLAPTAPAAARPAPDAVANGLEIGTTALSVPADAAAPLRPAYRASWPVGKRTGTLTQHTAPGGTTGAPSQNFESVKVVQRRAASTVGATSVLAAVPTPETRAKITFAFGRLSTDGAVCNSPAGQNWTFPSVKSDPDVSNPVYDGATITVRPFVADVARNAQWDCAFAKSEDFPTNPDAPPVCAICDQVATSSLEETIQKPILQIVVTGRELRPGKFTEVPIRVSNSIRTIATAPDVRLSWKTTRVTVRAPRDLGSIKPGTGKKTSFMIKRTEKGPARVTFTATSRNYRVSVTLKLEPGGS